MGSSTAPISAALLPMVLPRLGRWQLSGYTLQIEQARLMGKRRADRIVRTGAIAVVAVNMAWIPPSFLVAQPTTELETTYRGKVTNPHGIDGESSICTANIGGLAIKLQSAALGTRGVPTSISLGLVGARMMLGQAKQKPENNTRDFGNVGCMSMKMTRGFDGKPLAKRLFTTSCFMVEGGYLNLTIAGDNAKQIGFEKVKPLLEKAAARR